MIIRIYHILSPLKYNTTKNRIKLTGKLGFTYNHSNNKLFCSRVCRRKSFNCTSSIVFQPSNSAIYLFSSSLTLEASYNFWQLTGEHEVALRELLEPLLVCLLAQSFCKVEDRIIRSNQLSFYPTVSRKQHGNADRTWLVEREYSIF